MKRQLYVVYDTGIIRDKAEFKRNFEDAPAYQCLWSSSDPSLHGRDACQMIRHFRVAQDGLRKGRSRLIACRFHPRSCGLRQLFGTSS
jgi:hypothetical protein